MTSKSSSLDKFIKFQTNILRERMWQLVVVSFLFLIYYIGGSATAVFFIKTNYTDKNMQQSLLEATKIVFSGGVSAPALVCMAVASALLGFSNLYNRQKVDFYEAQPIKRSFRWWNIFLSGIYIVLLPHIVIKLIGFIFMSVIGAVNQFLLWGMITSTLKALILYTAVYAVTTLAAMICGNVIIAIMGTVVLLWWYDDLKLVFTGFADQMYATYVGDIFTSNRFNITYSLNPIMNYAQDYQGEWQHKVLNIVIALVATLLAYFIFTKRKNEMTGMAIAFKPLRTPLKVALATTWTLNVTWLYLMSVNGRRSVGTVAFMIAVIVINSIIVSLILEAILSFNIRACLRNFSNVGIVAMLSLIVYLGMYYDVLGYDRYVPNSANVESYGLCRSAGFNYLDDEGNANLSQLEYVGYNMKLTDKDTMTKLASIATANTLDLKKSGKLVNGYETTFLYRLANGKTVARQLIIPYNIDAAIMDQIVGSEEYKDGYFPHRNDGTFLKYYKDKQEICYSYCGREKRIKNDVANKYEQLKAAYDKDLEKYSYTLMKNGTPIGSVTLEGSKKENYESRSYYADSTDIEFPVYEGYDNTIAFLKENDIWIDNSFSTEGIKKVKVTMIDHDSENVYGLNLGEWEYDYDEDGYLGPGETSIEYTEKDKIAEIMDNVYQSYGMRNWSQPDADGHDYYVYVYYDKGSKPSVQENESD
ncbi:MAG: DUF6449 domain-containing protein, partial [Lachnospiraceae bacterium]|nr:DUF6449 domain-containing protein [Lachnospiraceae bacterium]